MINFWEKDILKMESPSLYKFEDDKLQFLYDLPFSIPKSMLKEDNFIIYRPTEYFGNAYTSIIMQGLLYKYFNH